MSQERNLCDIAQEIRADWEHIWYGAAPYVEAMECITAVGNRYGTETGHDVVRGFLGNCQHWRGGNARRIKEELRRMVGQ